MDFRTKTDITPLNPSLCHSDKLLVMGSCFAEHIGARLERMKFHTIINPYGVLYNPLSIAEGLTRLIEQPAFTEEELHEFPDGGWNTWMHHSRYSNPDKHTALTAINSSMTSAADQLAKADVLILTLGTAWVYRLIETGEVVGNCHKVPERRFLRQRLQVQEIVDALAKILRRTSEINPRLRVIFTISPVRHLKDGLHGNQLSKATLQLAVDELCRMHPERFYYFPAYEIVVDELRDYRFYADDMMHPTPMAIEHIWQRFADIFFPLPTKKFLQAWEEIRQGLSHRPFNPEGEQYKQFLSQIELRIHRLKEKYPTFDAENELDLCRTRLKK